MTRPERTEAGGPDRVQATAPSPRRPGEDARPDTGGTGTGRRPLVLALGPPRAGAGAVAELVGTGPSARDLDERLLARLGGSWDRPPRLEPGWDSEEALGDLLAEAGRLINAAPGGTGPLVLADRPLPLLLPFWRRAARDRVLALLVERDPAAIAAELDALEDQPPVRGLALYECYVRAALGGLAGLPVCVVRHEELDEGRRDLAKRLAALVEEWAPGTSVPAARQRLPPAADEVAPGPAPGEVDGAGSRIGLGTGPGAAEVATALVLPEQRRLHEAVSSLAGFHERFAPVDAGPESAWGATLLGLERDLGHVVAALAWASHQLEPLLRATPDQRVSGGPADRSRMIDEGSEPGEPDEKGLYPLNASEDRRAFHRWLAARRMPIVVGGPTDPPLRRARAKAPLLRRDPLVSLLVPVWKTPMWALERCISSVLAQSYRSWELCLCDDASGDAELTAYLRALRKADRRIRTTALPRNGGISAATNGALAISRGRFVAFLDHDDELSPDALAVVARALADNPDADVLYSDEDKIDASGERFDPLFKPDWSPDLLLSFQYLGHLMTVRRDLVVELGGLRSDFDGSQDYDLALRATERARSIVHVPEVLYHWRTLPGSAASDASGTIAKPWAYEAGLRAIADALRRAGEEAEVTQEPRFAGRYHVRRALASRPLVSVVVPFRDEPGLLATCCTSLRADPGYDRVELVLVDNGSELPETAALLERLEGGPGVRIIEAPGPFNWAAINNRAVAEAKGEVLLFANNDVEARSPRWLHAMLGHALRPAVGAVGARLVYPDGAIQHAGVVVGLGGIAGHVLRGLPGWHPGYNSMAIQTRDCSVVTGACMMTRREVFEAVGGFDEELPVAFNDVDYCLSLRERGYLVVYTPLAELVHHESRSRGHTDDLAESKRILERWGHVIVAGDPYLNRNLSHWRYWCPLSTAQEDDRWKTYLETSVSTHARSSST